MALIECHFFSDVLQLACSMRVILPQPTPTELATASTATRRYPTLFLLHGLSDDHTAWTRFTAIERYAKESGIAIVMPAAGRSFYADMQDGPRYWQFISEELPAIARSFFPLSATREDNFVAGLSMGGYGAFKLALRHPDRFAAAASLSGALDMVRRTRDEALAGRGEFTRIFGDAKRMTEQGNDLFALANNIAAKANCPRLFQRCGTEDFLFEDNERFAAHAQALGLPLNYLSGPGDHNWAYWDTEIQQVLAWLTSECPTTAQPQP